MKKWLISARVMFGSAADTLDSHLAEICNYFNNRTTSGVTEGINTRIKLIIRQSYGFKNFDLMKEKLLACLSPYMRESLLTCRMRVGNDIDRDSCLFPLDDGGNCCPRGSFCQW